MDAALKEKLVSLADSKLGRFQFLFIYSLLIFTLLWFLNGPHFPKSQEEDGWFFVHDYIIFGWALTHALWIIPSAFVLSLVSVFLIKLLLIEPTHFVDDDFSPLSELQRHPIPAINHLPDLFYVCPDYDGRQIQFELAAEGVDSFSPPSSPVDRISAPPKEWKAGS